MELNKVFKLTSGQFDVAGIIRTRRILYFKKEKKIIIVSSLDLAKRIIGKYGYQAEILSPSQATRRYPAVFKNSAKTTIFDAPTRTIMLRVPSEMYAFCCRQGSITAYLQSLIKREMQKKNVRQKSSL